MSEAAEEAGGMEGGSDSGYGTGERMEVGWYCRRPSYIAESEAIAG